MHSLRTEHFIRVSMTALLEYIEHFAECLKRSQIQWLSYTGALTPPSASVAPPSIS